MKSKTRKYTERNCLKCLTLIRTRVDQLKGSSGCCISCAQRKKPFESIYNSLKNDHRKINVLLSYDEYLEFTQIKSCHYCESQIPWVPYGTVDGKFGSRAYFLDRTNNTKGYSVDNCVTCCTKCNLAKGNRYSYEEWYGMTEFFRRVK